MVNSDKKIPLKKIISKATKNCSLILQDLTLEVQIRVWCPVKTLK